jgi:threonine aldolase
MKKELIATFCVLTILASAAPIFAATPTTTTNKPVVLTPTQITKLNTTQKELTNLITKIDALKAKYNNNTKDKILLVALNHDQKQANKLNTEITNYLKNPTAPANKKINTFQIQTKELQWEVANTAQLLKKVNKPKPIHPVLPIHPVTTNNTTASNATV